MNEKLKEININPRVLEYIDKGITNSTKKAYKSDWEDFEKFCSLKNYQSLPAKYETIGEYLVYLSDDIGNDSFIQQILISNWNGIKDKRYSIKLYKV